MKTLDWINNEIIACNQICGAYVRKVRDAKSKKQLFEICCDANGINFLCDMRNGGSPLPYEVITEEFDRYINGKYKPQFEGTINPNICYTSAIYCQDKSCAIMVDTTLACFMDCQTTVNIAPFNVARICLDSNCKIKLYCPPNASVVVERWGESCQVEVIEGNDRVTIEEK